MSEDTDDAWKVRLLSAGQSYDQLQAIADARQAERVKLSPAGKKLADGFVAETLAMGFFMTTFFRGREAFEKGQVEGLDPRIVLVTSAWLKSPSELPIAMPAVSYVTCLESFMLRVAPLAAQLKRSEVERVYASHKREKRRHKEKSLSLEDFLATRLQPSATRGGEAWFGQLERCLGVTAIPLVKDTVGALIEFRNAYVHGSRPKLEMLVLVKAGLVPAWARALELVAHDVALAVDGVLAAKG